MQPSIRSIFESEGRQSAFMTGGSKSMAERIANLGHEVSEKFMLLDYRMEGLEKSIWSIGLQMQEIKEGMNFLIRQVISLREEKSHEDRKPGPEKRRIHGLPLCFLAHPSSLDDDATRSRFYLGVFKIHLLGRPSILAAAMVVARKGVAELSLSSGYGSISRHVDLVSVSCGNQSSVTRHIGE
ncbi:hypothetical protein ACLOJK_028762 [Asimina triloba]